MKTNNKQYLASEKDMLNFGARLAAAIQGGAIIFLNGPLGAGKTTLTRGFLQQLGYTAKVKSPTYTLVEPYDINGRMIFHFDFYRLNSPAELEFIGIQDYFTPDAICLIEWPEKGFPLLPAPDLICDIIFNKTGRDIVITAQSEKGQETLRRIT
jgi:tRNA threonylcarbamoyladenosine biosynthesis protein TsaE